MPTQTQLMCSPQTDQTLTCSCNSYNMLKVLLQVMSKPLPALLLGDVILFGSDFATKKDWGGHVSCSNIPVHRMIITLTIIASNIECDMVCCMQHISEFRIVLLDHYSRST